MVLPLDTNIKFILKINDTEIEVPSSIIPFLASNTNGVMNFFLAGFFKTFPTDEDFKKMDQNLFVE